MTKPITELVKGAPHEPDNLLVYYERAEEGTAYSSAGIIALCPSCGHPGEKRHKLTADRERRYVHVAQITTTKQGHGLIVVRECKVVE